MISTLFVFLNVALIVLDVVLFIFSFILCRRGSGNNLDNPLQSQSNKNTYIDGPGSNQEMPQTQQYQPNFHGVPGYNQAPTYVNYNGPQKGLQTENQPYSVQNAPMTYPMQQPQMNYPMQQPPMRNPVQQQMNYQYQPGYPPQQTQYPTQQL